MSNGKITKMKLSRNKEKVISEIIAVPFTIGDWGCSLGAAWGYNTPDKWNPGEVMIDSDNLTTSTITDIDINFRPFIGSDNEVRIQQKISSYIKSFHGLMGGTIGFLDTSDYHPYPCNLPIKDFYVNLIQPKEFHVKNEVISR